MWEEWDQKIPGGGRYYGITWIIIKPDLSNNEFSLKFFFKRNVGVVIAGLQWAKENITSAKFCCFWIWSVSFLFISVFEKSLKVIIAYANLNLSDKKWRIKSRYENFWWTIISSSIYLPTFSVISVLFKLSRQKCKRNPFLSIQGELFNSAVGKRDIMHRRTIKKFLYTVIISNEVVFH